MNSTNLRKTALALALTFLAVPAWADWDNGGDNVVKFDLRTNLDRILFSSAVRPGELSTNVFKYANALSIMKDDKLTDITGLEAGVDFAIEPMEHYWIPGAPTDRIYKSNTVSSAPTPCGANRTDCHSQFHSLSSAKCQYTQVSAALSGSTSPEIDRISIPLTANLTGEISYSQGWATCTGETAGVTCVAANNLPYASYTYGTSETSGVMTYARLAVADGAVSKKFVASSTPLRWRQRCINAGGTFREVGRPGDILATCSNMGLGTLVTDFGIYPSKIAPLITTCRVIKQ